MASQLVASYLEINGCDTGVAAGAALLWSGLQTAAALPQPATTLFALSVVESPAEELPERRLAVLLPAHEPVLPVLLLYHGAVLLQLRLVRPRSAVMLPLVPM